LQVERKLNKPVVFCGLCYWQNFVGLVKKFLAVKIKRVSGNFLKREGGK